LKERREKVREESEDGELGEIALEGFLLRRVDT